MSSRVIGTAIVAVTVVGLFTFMPPGTAVAAPKAPRLFVTERAADVRTNIAPEVLAASDATCNVGETVTGGGFHWGRYDPLLDDFGLEVSPSPQSAMVVRSSQWDSRTWRVTIANTSAEATIDMRAFVMCATIQ